MRINIDAMAVAATWADGREPTEQLRPVALALGAGELPLPHLDSDSLVCAPRGSGQSRYRPSSGTLWMRESQGASLANMLSTPRQPAFVLVQRAVSVSRSTPVGESIFGDLLLPSSERRASEGAKEPLINIGAEANYLQCARFFERGSLWR